MLRLSALLVLLLWLAPAAISFRERAVLLKHLPITSFDLLVVPKGCAEHIVQPVVRTSDTVLLAPRLNTLIAIQAIRVQLNHVVEKAGPAGGRCGEAVEGVRRGKSRMSSELWLVSGDAAVEASDGHGGRAAAIVT